MLKSKQAQNRKEENEFVLNLMKNKNHTLALQTPLSAFRFQPRPIIKKDREAMKRAYTEE